MFSHFISERNVARHTFKDLTSFGLLFDTPFASTNIGIALPPLGYTNIRGVGADIKLGAWEGVGSSSECPFEMADSEFGFEAESSKCESDCATSWIGIVEAKAAAEAMLWLKDWLTLNSVPNVA